MFDGWMKLCNCMRMFDVWTKLCNEGIQLSNGWMGFVMSGRGCGWSRIGWMGRCDEWIGLGGVDGAW